MAKYLRAIYAVISVFWILTVSSASAQMPDKFTNLQFFPKDIAREDLMQRMRGFSFALGVRCAHCHVQKSGNLDDLNFPADDKQTKKTARLMLSMVDAINRDYVGKVQDPQPVRVECVTCHHKLAQPRTLKSVLSDSLDKKGTEPTVALYKNLREQYFGTGAYDFGESQMNQLVEDLLHAKRNKEAAVIAELNNEENHPTTMWSLHLLAMAHDANGEKEKAKADYQKTVELHPDDKWAKQQLEALSKPESK